MVTSCTLTPFTPSSHERSLLLEYIVQWLLDVHRPTPSLVCLKPGQINHAYSYLYWIFFFLNWTTSSVSDSFRFNNCSLPHLLIFKLHKKVNTLSAVHVVKNFRFTLFLLIDNNNLTNLFTRNIIEKICNLMIYVFIEICNVWFILLTVKVSFIRYLSGNISVTFFIQILVCNVKMHFRFENFDSKMERMWRILRFQDEHRVRIRFVNRRKVSSGAERWHRARNIYLNYPKLHEVFLYSTSKMWVHLECAI